MTYTSIYHPPKPEKRLTRTSRGDFGYSMKPADRESVAHLIFKPFIFIAQ